MASVNKVILIGNLGRDPELRYAGDNGTPICNITIATSRRYKDATGTLQEETEWHRIVFFSRQAEVAQQYLRKGSPVYVEGRLRTRRYTDKDGIERFQTEIICETLQLLPSGRTGAGSMPAAEPEDDGFETPRRAPAARAPEAPRQATPRPATPAPAPAPVNDSFGDADIPF